VLIIGAGVVGLTLAQGCRNAGIPFEIYEQLPESSERSQGWGLSLHWSLNALERTIGPELTARLPETDIDSTVKPGEGGFLLLNAASGEMRYDVRHRARYYRAGRQKLREVLSTGLDIKYGKKLETFETTKEGEVIAKFRDGSSTKGRLLIGVDGNNSAVRTVLMGGSQLSPLPINLIGVVRHFTAEEIAPARALNPYLFFAVHPETHVFFFYSIQEVLVADDGTKSYDVLVGVSYLVKDASDTVPSSSADRILEIKRRAANFVEPMHSMIANIPPDNPTATCLRLADFPALPWDNSNGLVTLAGDAAHAMTMYRGEGANHGILDAALLLDQLKRIWSGECSQAEGIKVFEAEMQERTHVAVLRSRQAAYDGHNWEAIHDGSPLIGMRVPPITA